MQDAMLIYYMVANVLHAGYFADVAKTVRQAAERLHAVVIGLRNSNRSRSTGAMPQMTDCAPGICGEFEDWLARLTRMESYVLSMR